MSGEVEALGGLATAGLAARALDGPAAVRGGMAAGDCRNCGTPLAGHFCAHCGQRGHVHRSLAHVGEEFVHGITHFDGKAWTTLPMLLFRPGRLTRDYVLGRRARYIAPVALFLMVVFLMFFVFGLTGIETPNVAAPIPATAAQIAEAKRELPDAERAVAEIDGEIAAAQGRGETANAAVLTTGRAALVAARDRIAARAAGAPLADGSDLAEAIRDARSGSKVDVDLGDPALNQRVRKALGNPELALYKIQSKAYKLSFLLVPLSLPWLWLIFAWKRGVRFYDHAVFALYSISFMSLLFITGSLLAAAGVENNFVWALLIVVAPLTHMFVQLKGAYALRTFSALWRTGALAVASVLTLSLYAALIVVLGVVD